MRDRCVQVKVRRLCFIIRTAIITITTIMIIILIIIIYNTQVQSTQVSIVVVSLLYSSIGTYNNNIIYIVSNTKRVYGYIRKEKSRISLFSILFRQLNYYNIQFNSFYSKCCARFSRNVVCIRLVTIVINNRILIIFHWSLFT